MAKKKATDKNSYPGRKLSAFARVTISPEAEKKLRRMMHPERLKHNSLLKGLNK